jgi:hypothetical protein
MILIHYTVTHAMILNTYHDLTLGAINFITSTVLPFNFNLDPLTIIGLITTSAQEHNVDLGPLTGLFELVIDNPSFHPPVCLKFFSQPAPQ